MLRAYPNEFYPISKVPHITQNKCSCCCFDNLSGSHLLAGFLCLHNLMQALRVCSLGEFERTCVSPYHGSPVYI